MPKGIYKKTKEHIKKISDANKGRKNSEQAKINISIGTKKAMLCEEVRENMSKARLGKPSLLKGRRLSEDIKKRISESTRKAMNTPEVYDKISGKNHYRWIKDRSILVRNKRNDPEYKQWRIRVKRRDNNVCQLKDESCEGYMIAAHIKGWALYIEDRYQINNGITLCQGHHPRTRNEDQRLMPVFQELVGSK